MVAVEITQLSQPSPASHHQPIPSEFASNLACAGEEKKRNLRLRTRAERSGWGLKAADSRRRVLNRAARVDPPPPDRLAPRAHEVLDRLELALVRRLFEPAEVVCDEMTIGS